MCCVSFSGAKQNEAETKRRERPFPKVFGLILRAALIDIVEVDTINAALGVPGVFLLRQGAGQYLLIAQIRH
jgi:hypothetical protein